MKIAVNATPLLSPLTGVGNYAGNILRLLRGAEPEIVYSYYYGYGFSKRLFSNDLTRLKIHDAKEQVKRIPGIWPIARAIKDNITCWTPGTFDLYFEPNFIPIRIKAKRTVVSVMDFSFENNPQWHPAERIRYFRKKFWQNIGRADKIIVISDFVRDEAVQKFRLPKEKIEVIKLGFNRQVFKCLTEEEKTAARLRLKLPERFVLSVGSLEPRKNLLKLLKAYSNIAEQKRGVKLVLAGFKGWENSEVMDVLKKLEGSVIYLGYVGETDLCALYNLAECFVYPSLYEGFGLPPLEAMACGCPVVVSNVASLPEVCGEAAVYVNPEQVESIAEGILSVTDSDALQRELSLKGLARAEQFSWEKAAAKHLEIFRSI